MKSDHNLPFTNKKSDQVVFQNPWHSQLFAITVQLSEKGNFSWEEFVKVFGEALKKERLPTKNLDGSNDYFTCWLNALEELILNKKLGNKKSFSIFKKKWEKAFLNTPHGKPVKI